MKKFNSAVLACVLAVSSLGAVASDSVKTYDYVDVAYNLGELDGLDSDNGFVVSGSKSLGDLLFVRGSFSRLNDAGVSPSDELRLGVGAKYGLTKNIDAYGSVSAIKTVNAYPFTTDSFGTSVEGGVRASLGSRFEVRGGVVTERLAEGPESWDTFGIVGASVAVTDWVAVVGDVRANSDAKFGTVGVRFTF